MNTLKKTFVYILEPQKVLLFNVITALLGYTYSGREQSSVYTIIMIALFLLSMLYYFRHVVLRLGNYFFTVFLFILVVSLSFIVFSIKNSFDYQYAKYYYFFFIFSLGSIIWGINFGKNFCDNISVFIKMAEPIILIIAVFSVVAVYFPAISGNSLMRSSSYQSASYYSAFAFGGLLFFLLSNKKVERFPIFNKIVMKVVYAILLYLIPISVISTGGRGGFVLILAYVVVGLYMILSNNREGKKKHLGLFIAAVILLVVVGFFIVSTVSNNSSLQDSFKITVQYLDFKNRRIDMGETSNRDIIYSQAWELIKQKPVFGYGFFSYMPLLTSTYQYPHNFFLEVLLQGGFVYLIIVLFVLIVVIRKIKAMLHNDYRAWIILFLFMYPSIMLMFSGSYMTTSLFWFCITVILTARCSNECIKG